VANVLFLSPGYPAEMPHFATALSRVGERVYGLGDQPAAALPAMVRAALSDHLVVRSLWDEDAVVEAVAAWKPKGGPIERVESLWEPSMLLAARIRERLGVPGMSVAETVPFRDKGAMKQVLEKAGIRTPRHARSKTAAGVREAAERIGWPICVKPIAGAGSADTYRVRDAAQLEEVLPRLRHVEEVSVEEFVEGEEHTFDTVCSGGRILYRNVSWYRPNPLVARSTEWISPQTIALRDLGRKDLAAGHALGEAVIRALGYRDGFTHMEWFLTRSGEAVFGEIGARPPGARSVDLMNYASDADLFLAWAEGTTRGRISQDLARRWNVAIVFKRAQGRGRIRAIEGLERLLASIGEHVVAVDLLPVGTPRRDWRQTLVSDGFVILRHPDLATTCEMADRVGTDLAMYAS
jgi:formate-dependent phosphoribosylglycinamide formyltransferase (GAR transformylase)